MRRRLLLALPALLAACGSTPTQVFTFSASEDRAPRPAPAGRTPLVHVDRATVAEYFDRTQMVTRIGAFRVSVHEFAVWSEPVADLISNAVVDDLARRFGDDRVLRTPRGRGGAADVRVELDVLRLDVDEAGTATLDVRWSVVPMSGQPTQRRERILATAADPKDATSRVVALRETLTRLSATIADAIAAPRPATRP
ncbi:MAG: PqiC family protein [Acetobacteraceae bacterium]|nr:PqiC family protein [Acetobacteraceae bacterium]